MANLILFFLFTSLLLYTILGGADFGAGILELFTRKKNTQRVRHLTYKAIGPVWEANHIWLILVVVLLFVAFPEVYRLLSVHLHIPIMLMLLGIILRGAAFVFRHYDAIKDGSQKAYSRIFISGSFLAPLFLGITAGATILGAIDPQADNFYTAYLAPWLNPFAISVGLFYAAVCAFLAAVFFVGETEEESLRRMFYRQATIANLFLILIGGLVFLSASWQGLPLLSLYGKEPLSLISIVLASVLVPLLWWSLNRNRYQLARLLAAMEVAVILFGWLWLQSPNMVRMQNDVLSIQDALAPPQVLTAMGWVLLAGSLLIFPSLYYLFRVFKFGSGGS